MHTSIRDTSLAVTCNKCVIDCGFGQYCTQYTPSQLCRSGVDKTVMPSPQSITHNDNMININCLAPTGVEWRFVHKVSINCNIFGFENLYSSVLSGLASLLGAALMSPQRTEQYCAQTEYTVIYVLVLLPVCAELSVLGFLLLTSDSMGLVLFNQDATVELPLQNFGKLSKQDLKMKISDIRAGGMTNLSKAATTAASLFTTAGMF